MRIIYHMPFKPLGHPNPSGDLIIGTELHDYLQGRGHALQLAGGVRTRWIYWKPWLWPLAYARGVQAARRARRHGARVWLTYHSYYKSPDIIGPMCAKKLGIPYVIFQGIYSTKRRRRLKTLPGFWLNRRALVSADFVFTNKKRDHTNLSRIVAKARLKYVGPGLVRNDFPYDPGAREVVRRQWAVGDRPVILSAAMFRPGVKTRGVLQVIQACAKLLDEDIPFQLVLAGDGRNRPLLERTAEEQIPGCVRFLGKVSRDQLYRYYSAADIFAFPGIEESLGMVYLEAQACGLPVLAMNGWGAEEAVVDGKTGLLSHPEDTGAYERNMIRLIRDVPLRRKMGRAAMAHVDEHHDLEANYGVVERILSEVIDGEKFKGAKIENR